MIALGAKALSQPSPFFTSKPYPFCLELSEAVYDVRNMIKWIVLDEF